MNDIKHTSIIIGEEISTPLYLMTNDQWQVLFKGMRKQIKPRRSRRMYGPTTPTESADSYYSRCINDILCQIRRHRVDYCFRLDHIQDLLTFHPDDLRSDLIHDGTCTYFRVYLDKEGNSCL